MLKSREIWNNSSSYAYSSKDAEIVISAVGIEALVEIAEALTNISNHLNKAMKDHYKD